MFFTSRQSSARPRLAVVLVTLAVVAWGILFFRQTRSAPVLRHIEAGRDYARQGKGPSAEREWWDAVRADPNNATAWELLGNFYMSTGDFAKGVVPFRQLLRVRPLALGVHGPLAICLLRAGDEIAAYKEAQEALKREPDDSAAMAVSAILLSNMGEQQREVGYLRRLVKMHPDDLDMLTMLAETLTFTHNYAEARTVLEQIMKLAPNNAEAYSLRGFGWFNEEPGPEGVRRAEADLRTALKLNPFAPFPRLYLGKLYNRIGKADKAVFQLEEAARMMPGKMDIYYELGEAYSRANRPSDAVRARARFETMRRDADRENSLSKRCAVYPDNFEDHLALGLIKLNKGDYRLAKMYLSQAKQLRPNDTKVDAAVRRLTEQTDSIPENGGVPGSAAAPDSRSPAGAR